MFAVEQHRGFVLLALADDHDAVEVHGLQEGAHGVHGGAVGLVLVAETHPVAAGDGRGFGDADKFQGEVAVRLIVPTASEGESVEYSGTVGAGVT